MPDLELRFHKDMLVLSAPLDAALARQGVCAARDRQYLNLMEPDVIEDALRLEVMAGAQCVVTTTEDITQARLAHLRMDSDQRRLAQAALDIAKEVRPQHILAEIGPCGLPLDASSKASLNENRAQYAGAARAFEGAELDAFFLNGFTSVADLKCALMGVSQVSGKPVIASVLVGSGGHDAGPVESASSAARSKEAENLPDGLPFAGYELLDEPPAPPRFAPRGQMLDRDGWAEAIYAMVDLGACVVGFETADPISEALKFVSDAAARTSLPLLAQLRVTSTPGEGPARNLVPLEEIDDYTPDTMAPDAVKLYGAGVQFLRATGLATPTFTGALAATVQGLDVRGR